MPAAKYIGGALVIAAVFLSLINSSSDASEINVEVIDFSAVLSVRIIL
jgi:hypothetical protein